MRNPFGRKPASEPVRKMYFIIVTPPSGSAWLGAQAAISESEAREKAMGRFGKTKQESAGRISAVLLRPPAGMEYREKDFTITGKSREKFLQDLLIGVN